MTPHDDVAMERARIDVAEDDAFDRSSAEVPACFECTGTITGEPVLDEEQQTWLPPDAWDWWCSQDCHDTTAEKGHVE